MFACVHSLPNEGNGKMQFISAAHPLRRPLWLVGWSAIWLLCVFPVCLAQTVSAVGQNLDGQLGNGADSSSNVPVQVSNLTEITAIAACGSHSLAVKSDGTVW